VLITSISGAEQIGSTTLTFAPVITDGDGDTAHASTDLSVALNGTANVSGGYDLTGSNTVAEVLVASAGTDHLNGGTGPGDTIDYSNSNAPVTVNLETNAVSGGWAANDIISNFENVIGSAFADTLTGGAGSNTLTGGAGADHFVYNATTEGLDNIVDFTPGSDVLDFKSSAFGNLAVGTLSAANFDSNATGTPTHAGPEFIYNTTSHILSFDSDGTGVAVAIQMAHLENGVPLAAANITIHA
jgi:Ca2+-binding RTX toxin-like protein